MNRPQIREGAICKFSKKCRWRRVKSLVLVVLSVRGDGTSRNSKITCAYQSDGVWTKGTFRREQLWFTGKYAGQNSMPGGNSLKHPVHNKVRLGSDPWNDAADRSHKKQQHKNEEECWRCKRMKDVGKKCWWCGH